MNKETKIGIALAVSIGAIVYFGFGTHQASIDSYSTEFNTHVLAKYSETDFDLETDYWEELVSAEWYVLTVRDSVVKYNCPIGLITGYTCQTPEITIDHPKISSFDKYQKVRDITYYADYGDGDFSKVDKEGYEAARLKIGELVIVKTWYGGAYGFEY